MYEVIRKHFLFSKLQVGSLKSNYYFLLVWSILLIRASSLAIKIGCCVDFLRQRKTDQSNNVSRGALSNLELRRTTFSLLGLSLWQWNWFHDFIHCICFGWKVRKRLRCQVKRSDKKTSVSCTVNQLTFKLWNVWKFWI